MKLFSLTLVFVSFVILLLGVKYINHLEVKDRRHVAQETAQNIRYLALCEKLDCVSPKMTVQGDFRRRKKKKGK